MIQKLREHFPSNRQDAFFVAAQVAVVLLLVSFVPWRAKAVNIRSGMPAINIHPRVVRPQYDYPFVVSDQQLADVLSKLHPKFSQRPTKINYIDHALRMWGAQVEFGDGSYSGQQMLQLLLDHDAFGEVWGHGRPLLHRTANGIAVTTQEGRSSVSHVDHLMGTLAEIGVPLSYPVHTSEGDAAVRGILENGLKSFRLNQREYEWTALTAAFYASSVDGWYTSEGQWVDFNTLAGRLMRQPQPEGVCYGQHRIYTLTILLRVDEQLREAGTSGLLNEESRDLVTNYLLGMTQRLFHSQAVEGYWDGNWPDPDKPVPDPTTDAQSRRILATGHALEWWAMAPKKLHPPRASIVSAAQWLVREISEMDEVKVEKNYTFLTHAGRALALWRGVLPGEYQNETSRRAAADRSL